jgi:pantoate--beta-alanine ligase
MKVINLKSELFPILQKERSKGRKIGLVPTMGALHSGHVSLVKASINEADTTVCSIFVNPTQFNNKEDLLKYPKTFDEDLSKLKQAGCDIVYAPAQEDLYENESNRITDYNFGEFELILEGKYRPGHFGGVALVVSKLFNIISPDFTYFGQKDLQQFHLIRQLIRDLSYDIRIRCVPTVREKDGLAMSSRNLRIPEEQRSKAAAFYKCLITGREMLMNGESISSVKNKIEEVFAGSPDLKLEYFEMIDTRNFKIIDQIKNENETSLCIAGYLNNIRLIDNVNYI